MSARTRVLNITSGKRIPRNQAAGRIEQCISDWVVADYSIRDLTLAETVSRRSEQSKMREPLALVEIPGLVYRAGVGREAGVRDGYRLARDANEFAQQAS